MSSTIVHEHAKDRHRLVRAGFIAKGTTLTAWCRSVGVKHPNAINALQEKWKGPKARALVARMMEAAAVQA